MPYAILTCYKWVNQSSSMLAICPYTSEHDQLMLLLRYPMDQWLSGRQEPMLQPTAIPPTYKDQLIAKRSMPATHKGVICISGCCSVPCVISLFTGVFSLLCIDGN